MFLAAIAGIGNSPHDNEPMHRRRRAHRRQSHADHAQDLRTCGSPAHQAVFFALVYMVVIMETDPRRLVHANVITAPMLP